MNPIRKWLTLLLIASGLALAGCNDSSSSSTPSTDGTTTITTTAISAIGAGSIVIDGIQTSDPKESIYVRKVGHGPQTLVLVPGNNTSGKIFEGMLQYFRSIEAFNNAYTVYTFDYRGSGNSSYNKEITSLKDFALDFEKVMNKIDGFPTSGVTLVGYSMGFGVALEMMIANPSRYANIVSLTGIGTRGVRVSFANAGQAGTDSAGQTWAVGDWVTVTDDAKGITAAGFQQRSWQGDQRTLANVKFVWDMVVYNDVLKYNINTFAIGDATFTNDINYENSLLDGLYVQYMPESLYYAHKFNVSNFDVTHTNGSGSVVTIAGDRRLGTLLNGKKALLVKATTDFATWRGDQVIYDNYTATSKYDLKQAGGTVTAVMIGANQGYDHGFPVSHPLQTVKLIDAFLGGNLSSSSAATALGVTTVTLYPNSETAWETSTFTGF